MYTRALVVSLVVLSLCAELAEAQSSRRPQAKMSVPAMPSNEPSPEIKDCLGWKPLEEGDVGRLPYPYRVIQVVDENNAIVEINYYPWVSRADMQQETVWMKISTKGMADDKKYTTADYFKVAGTKKYDTAAGTTKTITMLETTENPNKAKIAAANAKAAEAKVKAAEAKTAADAKLKAERERRVKEDTRKWTSASGGNSITATFAGRIGDKIKLKKEDGTAITVSLDQLTEEDRDWVEKRSKKRR